MSDLVFVISAFWPVFFKQCQTYLNRFDFDPLAGLCM